MQAAVVAVAMVELRDQVGLAAVEQEAQHLTLERQELQIQGAVVVLLRTQIKVLLPVALAS